MIEVSYISEETTHEERMWEYYKKIEAENHHLKRQLDNKNRTIRRMKRQFNNLNTKYKKLTDNRKPKYRNNGKGGK